MKETSVSFFESIKYKRGCVIVLFFLETDNSQHWKLQFRISLVIPQTPIHL